MSRARARALGLALVVPVALAGAACGGDESGGEVSQEAVDDARADAGPAGEDGRPGGQDAPPFEANVGGLDVCGLLDTAEVEAALGGTLGPVAPDESSSGGDQCGWNLGTVTSGSGWVTLEHQPLEGEGEENAYASVVPDDGEAVDGVGDQAAIAPSPNGMRWTVAFVKGPWVMTITTESSLMTSAEREGVVGLARSVADRL